MTIEELKLKAKKYTNHNDWFELSANVDKIGNAIRVKMEQAYIAGAKENEIVWHDLRKDPNDIPPAEKNVLLHCFGYGVEFNTVGHRIGERYYSNLSSRVFDRVIKWAEISD